MAMERQKDRTARIAPAPHKGATAQNGAIYSLLVKTEEASGLGSFERDLRTEQAEYSPGLCRIYGLPPSRKVSRDRLLELVHPDDLSAIDEGIEAAVRDRTPFTLELRINRPDGQARTIRAHGSVILTAAGEPARLVGTVRDVTEEVEARSACELLARVVECSEDAILTKTRDGTITSWNRGAERLYQHTAEEAIGRPIGIIEPPGLEGEQAEMLRRVFSGESLDRFETERVRKDGERLFVSMTISPIRDSYRRVISAAVVARDVTERHRYEERLRYLADHDQLTGLFNRRRFQEEIKRELARAGRYQCSGAVISIGLDNFKAINDSAGHTAGDTVLLAVARAMTQRFRQTDVLARIGGDEFAVLLPDVDEAGARAAAEDLLGTLRDCRPLFGGRALKVHSSIGVAMFDPDNAAADEMQISADLAMYAAKNTGGDRVTVFSAEQGRQARSLVRQPWSERIRDALDYDRFVLHLQPILDLWHGQIRHGELLLRMRDSNDKLIAPNSFLPTAERTGLIHEVDRWVVRRGISLLAQADDAAMTDGLGINLSGASVTGDQHLLAVIESELKRTGVDPGRLIFEVTETAAIANMPEAMSFAQ